MCGRASALLRALRRNQVLKGEPLYPRYSHISQSTSKDVNLASSARVFAASKHSFQGENGVFGCQSKQWQVFIIEKLWNIYFIFFQETEELVCLDKGGLSKSCPALAGFPQRRLT